MIFEYKCRRCGVTITQVPVRHVHILAALDLAMSSKPLEEPGIEHAKEPLWIFHTDCEGIFYLTPFATTGRMLPIPGIGIADLIGGRDN